ncbi:hypothetical protein TG4357_01700 [Thalassovita gelatinovora]|uniref:Uncharacterized protein n=1 Tax=Thalassovita gelatinovora TaxID=53501 RepID=A0A0P1FAK5_THAGE|nr:hypothetical protein [Thalassovita gelatinovora]QIZ80625.1 hypothetical protein HFZ77_09110 [Thalassovita gelatinovora]CUH65171.1 hypothetical protein TG4357_01700 [Thalassovita gelatinovora]SER19988.1 hypothetical protein SAMN04488043_12119 [Thalassovita gelatinovora]
MQKLIALINVIAWAGFWSFGYLALTSDGFSDRQLVISAILACLGFGVGVIAYLKLARGAEASGYAAKTSLIDPAARERAQAEHPL